MEGDVPGEGAAGEDDEAVLEPGARIAAAIQAVESTEWGAPVSETGWAVVRALCGELVQKKGYASRASIDLDDMPSPRKSADTATHINMYTI